MTGRALTWVFGLSLVVLLILVSAWIIEFGYLGEKALEKQGQVGPKGHEATTQKTPDVLPQREPDVEGVLTSIERFSPRTEDCVDRSDLPPNQSISSDDPPSCTQLPTDIVGTVLLEEDPDSEWGDEKVRLTVTTDTLLFRESEGEYAHIPFDELERGHTLSAWVAGPIAESYPSQAKASVVVSL